MVPDPNPKPSEASARSDDCQAWAASLEGSALTSDDLDWGLGSRVFLGSLEITRRPRLWREVRGLGATLVLRGRGAWPSFTGRQRS